MNQIEELLIKMEKILDTDNFDHENDDDRLQGLHIQIEGLMNYGWEQARSEKELRELDKHSEKFERLNKKWESPEEQRKSTMDMMFPDEDSLEGFDMDDFFGLN